MAKTAAAKRTWTYDEITSIHLNLWRVLSILPFENHDLAYPVSTLLLIYFHVSNTIYNTMYVGYGVRMVAENRFEIDYVCELVMVQSLSLRYFMISVSRRRFAKLVQMCRELWDSLRKDESSVVKEFESKVHYYRNFFWWNSIAVVVTFMVTAQFVMLPPAEVNGTARRMLPFAFYVDVQEQPTFALVSLFQGWVCVNAAVILTGNETLGPFLIMMSCGYLRSVQNRLLVMAKRREEKSLREDQTVAEENNDNRLHLDDIIDCIKFHQKIMNFCQEIDLFLRKLFMTTLICTVYNLALIGLQILQNDEFLYKYISLLALNTMQLFICQWAPEHLLNESEAIAKAAYLATLEHAEYERKSNQLLLLVMLRAQKPVQLTAGGYVYLSIETFGHMVTNAFSFFTVVRSFSS